MTGRCSALSRAMLVGLALLAASPVFAADATLQLGSKQQYDDSIVEMARPHDARYARTLLLSLLILAQREQGMKAPESMTYFKDHPQAFYDALEPYAGMTADEIIAAAKGMSIYD